MIRLAGFLLFAFMLPATAGVPVSAVAYRADGKQLAAGTHGSVSLIDPDTGDSLLTLPGQTGRVTAVAFAKQDMLAVASGEPGRSGLIRLYASAKGQLNPKPIAEIRAHKDIIYALAFSPDGKTIASGSYDRVIKLWDVARPEQPQFTLLDHSDTVYALAFHPAGRLLASGSADRAVKVWDATTGKRLYTLSDPTDWVYAVAWSPDGRKLVAGGVDKSLRVWEANAEGGKLMTSVFAHAQAVQRLVYSADGTALYSFGEDSIIKRWNPSTMTETKVYEKQPETILALDLRPNGLQLAVGRFDGVGLFMATNTGKTGPNFLPAKPKPPKLSKIIPDAAPRGGTVRVRITGEHLDSITSIQAEGLTAKIVQKTPTELQADLTIPPTASIGVIPLSLSSEVGSAQKLDFIVDRYPAIAERGTSDSASSALVVKRPVTIAGRIDRTGDTDYFAFEAKAGEQIGVQISAVGGKLGPCLSLCDTHGSVLAESLGDSLGFIVPRDGRYAIGVRDQDYRGNAEMTYRLHLGEIPVVTSLFPLAATRGQEIDVHLDGVHLGTPQGQTVRLKVPADAAIGSRIPVRLTGTQERPLGNLSIIVSEFPSTVVSERGTELRKLPASADGIIAKPGQSQTISFAAKKGEPLWIETHARRFGSPLDSSIEILDATGELVPRAVLRCTAKTYSTFRDNDSVTSGIRLESWNELAMNDYLYVGSELMRIEALPKGPDDDCRFVSRGGQRLGYLGTTPTHHYLGNVMYRVEIHPPGTTFPPNGMPIFPIAYQNDDGGPGFGKDSMLLFDPPADGMYQVRIRDSRGSGSPAHVYRLTVRSPRPSFNIAVRPKSPTVWKGNGIPVTVTATRIDGYEGPIAVKLTGLPPGFEAPGSFIEAEQEDITLTLSADADAPPVQGGVEILCEATATIQGQSVTRSVPLGMPKLAEPGDLVTTVSTKSLEIQPGQEARFRVKVERRNNFTGRVPLDVQGLPHGVRVMNIGLNGILLTERDTEREVVIYAEPWVQAKTMPVTVFARRESTGQQFAAKPLTLTVK